MSLPECPVAANGIRLRVHQQGSGPPVWLLHGFRDSSSPRRHRVPALAGAASALRANDDLAAAVRSATRLA